MVAIANPVKELFDVKAHLGHKSSRVHPKAKKYIYTIQNGISIIDLTKTAEFLEKALQFVKQLAKENKILLMIATKKIASSKIQELCQKNSIPYVTNKWPAGLLTNIETITKNIKKLIQMKKEKTDGSWQKFVKHDRLKLEKELSKFERGYGGLIQMTKLPDALFIVDIKKEKNAVNEALRISIPVIAIADTNVDPHVVDFPIPANDDSLSSIEYIVNKVVDIYVKNKSESPSNQKS
ncbi:30S ribosomal protein S2 [Candidatus Roizmanbacteria bacterium RIFCSPLOWO2_01_FULL_37_12]|uniref:Small ribosomal subunit protein uS2 n=1 Tax=Candidatus Roizmanbacteria bacterium RIFCSPLOWO2_01_FULL_37_12 TaxID=1802056 RepID=A0A1F7IAH4_9BACT|nr:MAG: 30S ribosomal protein S2 [Candidatus Roizmanbacteria bacterium RIFCSPHIGHO2_02_FULL_37_9b]OGK40368.1 MAG: 30S ribosomal protein S2 [Candidatus Roizmanbacteria bacterium RIFCSPLOWO2_01_FULL_37_12]